MLLRRRHIVGAIVRSRLEIARRQVGPELVLVARRAHTALGSLLHESSTSFTLFEDGLSDTSDHSFTFFDSNLSRGCFGNWPGLGRKVERRILFEGQHRS